MFDYTVTERPDFFHVRSMRPFFNHVFMSLYIFPFRLQEALVSERVVKLVEAGLKSTHLPTKISALHGSLYLLEAGVTDLNMTLLPILTDFLVKHLTIVSQ